MSPGQRNPGVNHRCFPADSALWPKYGVLWVFWCGVTFAWCLKRGWKMKHKLVALLSVGLFAVATAASATSVVNIQVDGKSGTTTVTCDVTVDCDGLLVGGVIDESNADTFAGKPADEADIAAQFKLITGIDVAASDVKKFDTVGDPNPFTFSIAGGWFFVKAGDYRSYLFSDKATDVTFLKTGNDPGLSNYGTINTPNVIPLPAAGWLLLAGLGGLAAYGRKKRWA